MADAVSVGAGLLAKALCHSTSMSPDVTPSRASPLPQGQRAPTSLVVIDIQLAEGHFPAFGGVPGVVLHIDPGLEVQRLVAPGCADLRIPLIACRADA